MPGVLVREARDRSDYEACVRLQRVVWGLSDLEITSVLQLVATVHAGGLLIVADSPGDGVVGFCYAFAALRGGVPHLHSDMLGVAPAFRGLGLGPRLKWAQREAALGRGLRLVTWTFDPMRSANARLNLRHLAAVSRELLPDFYGETTSSLHHGLPTHRLLVRWDLASPRVLGRAAGAPLPAPGEPRPVLGLTWRSGLPVPSPGSVDVPAPVLHIEVPADWDAVCRADAALARAWQEAVRRAFERLFDRGYTAVDCVDDGPGARYVLRRDDLPGA
jgi:predicted GNAT superfamily acetyltransferase